ncbi:group 1 glycosyl transferase family [[Clostridium] sordellii]|uniref:glycosyltransferase family 4 protein n=1 Tax=Paraclostridium sordellii TaxID=1505 RepID=UPI0005DFF997|nr:glycosyltransferase family 4 protein [Paeniclostridium sordellii]CEN84562.1 group 1 glycosyl transferase family [[Clostridium] sordellii] [Paeniclostridium sordellii]CEO13783.1 group 1 glycosyl transferase family [[Clostridium] sordellii] [Paeniclostridium sordellii]
MNILFLTLVFSEFRGIYTDLMQEMKSRGHEVYVVTPVERKYNQDTSLMKINGLNVLKVKTGNIQKVNKLEKGISTLMLEKQFIKAIDKYLSSIKFDLIVYSTPPITFSNAVNHIKKRDGAKTYLMLKDIFPQNAVDIEMIKQDGLLYKFFRRKEISLYNISDYIGCMSQGNIDFLLKHNDFIEENKVEILPNTITPLNIENLKKEEINEIRSKYNVPINKKVLVYGGNLGKPQGIDFIIDCIKENEKRNDTFFLIVGLGTDYEKILNCIKEKNIKNTVIYPYMPKEDYDKLVKACDIGLVFLDKRFTIPNIPSRILTYMEFGMPIIAATDKNTDLNQIIETGKFGLWSESGKLEDFYENVDMLIRDNQSLKQMGMNGRSYLEKNFTSDRACSIIMKHF